MGKNYISVQEAPEPSDIIWEHRSTTQAQRRKSELTLLAKIILILLGSFCVILGARLFQYNKTKLYPYQTCGPFYEAYGDDLESFALLDYTMNIKAQENGKDTHFAGYL